MYFTCCLLWKVSVQIAEMMDRWPKNGARKLDEGDVMEPRPLGFQVNCWTPKAPIWSWHVKGVRREKKESKKEERERRHNTVKNCSSFGTRLRDPFQELVSAYRRACVFARVCLLPPFHALSRTHHSLRVDGVLLSPWVWRTAHQWVASIWRVSGRQERGRAGVWLSQTEMEDSIRHAISQSGTLAGRDRSEPSISLHYP